MKTFISVICWNGQNGADARFWDEAIPADDILLAKSVIRPTRDLVPATDESTWCMLIMRGDWGGDPVVYTAHPFAEIRAMIDEARSLRLPLVVA